MTHAYRAVGRAAGSLHLDSIKQVAFQLVGLPGHRKCVCNLTLYMPLSTTRPQQWGAADAEIEVPSGENTELKRSSFKAWSRSVYSHAWYAYCQGFLPCLFLPFQTIHLHFFQTPSRFLPCWLWLTHGSCVGPQNKIGHPAGCRFPC